jgi:hypothetical protein
MKEAAWQIKNFNESKMSIEQSGKWQGMIKEKRGK